jgi:tRNA dimethylallyltransferase
LAIGTAKPSAEEMDGVKHHFIDSHSITEEFNVNDFEKEALTILEGLFKTHQFIILTGGSGLYIDILCDGFDDEVPGSDKAIRTKIEALYQKYGIEILQEKLKQLDPEFYKEIDLSNYKRLERAIEVCLLTGKKYSEIRKGTKQERSFNFLKIGLERARAELFSRINQRVDIMIQQGLLEEAKSVVQHKRKNALRTVGYSELFDYFDEKCTLEEATEKIKVNSRKYAKRQMAWFNNNEAYTQFHPNNIAAIIEYISTTTF